MTPFLPDVCMSKKCGKHVVFRGNLVGESAKLLGQDVSSLAFNKSSIQRQREKHRKSLATMLQQTSSVTQLLLPTGMGSCCQI